MSEDPSSPKPDAAGSETTSNTKAVGPPSDRVRLSSNQPIYLVQKQPNSGRGFVSWLGWVLAGICLLAAFSIYSSNRSYFDNSGSIQEKYHSLSKSTGADKIVVLDASGVIMSGQGFVKQQIDQIRKDESIKGIVLRVDSPGGTVYGSDFMYHHLVKLRAERELPMVVSMGSVAASGGYYIAMAVGDQEKCIYAEPMTTTGSIGVILPHYNVAGLMEKYGVAEDSIATHPRKNMLSMSREMSEDDREVIGKYIDHAFQRFKEVIRFGRPKFAKNKEALDVLATGEIFTAKQAKESGLIDEIGFIEDAIERVIGMAGLEEDSTRVVTYNKPVTLMDALALGKSSDNNALKQLLELSTPRAYYLATPLPSVLSAESN